MTFGSTKAGIYKGATSSVAGYLVTLTIQTWTAFVQSLVDMTEDLFDGFAAEVRKVIG